MIKIQDFKTSTSDGNIFLKAIFKSLKVTPLLLWLNLILIIAITVGEGFYNYTFIYKLNNDFMTLISVWNFTFLKLIFLIFLVPFQLHNRYQPSHAVRFAPFIKRVAWPIAIDSIKALFIALAYGAVSLIIFIALIISVTLVEGFLGISVLTSYLAQLSTSTPNIFDIRYIALILTMFVIFLPFIIRSIQFHFIPFVIFFNQEYIQNKVSSLKLSIKVSQGIAILLVFATILLLSLLEILFIQIKPGISPSLSLVSLLSFSADSIIRSISVIFMSALLFFLYIAKDPSYNASSEK